MVKHFALIIGCIILSLSATLIVPTNCSPLGENEQKETNLVETRSKRQIPATTSTATSSASSSSSAQTKLLTSLFPLLAKLPPSPLFMGGGGGGGSNGLAGVLSGLSPQLLAILDPILQTLGMTVGSLGGTLDGTLDGLGGALGPLNQPLMGVGNVIESLFGGSRPSPGMGMPPPKSPILSALPLFAILQNQAKATSSAKAKSESISTLAG